MANQSKEFPDLDVPRIQAYLQDIILQLDGPSTEGIFRISANASEIAHLKKQFDSGIYQLTGAPSDMKLNASSLLKMWLRELPSPLIPVQLYDACIADPDNGSAILPRLPVLHRLVLTRLIHFLQVFVQPEYVACSRMGAANLAVVFAPALLRCPSEDLALLNSNQEQSFVAGR